MSAELFLLVFIGATCVDYCHANYNMAVEKRDALRASGWSILQWCGSLIGFVVAVKVSLWALPAEAAGLALGTYLAVRRKQKDFPSAKVTK